MVTLANENRSYYDAQMNTTTAPFPSAPAGAAAVLPVSATASVLASPDTVSPALPVGAAGGLCWRSEELLGQRDEALIAHGDQVYRLRRTGTGKLILTK